MDIPENFFGVGGEEDITVRTVTWPEVELPLPQNITEGEARGNVILTVKPILDISPTVLEPEEPFTFVPDVGATAFPETENGTREATRPWGFPEEATPGLGSVTAFTSEDLVVQVTVAPGETAVPGQPRLPGGKYPPVLGEAQGQAEGTWPGDPPQHPFNLTWDLGQPFSSQAFLSSSQTKRLKQTSHVHSLSQSFASKEVICVKQGYIRKVE